MDFYNLQESDHQLLEQAMDLNLESKEYRDYLKRQFFDLERLANKKCIVVVEADPRVQKIMQTLIREENRGSQCVLLDCIEEIEDVLKEHDCDLLVANYYTSEDEIDYEFWEKVRGAFPRMDVVILSHVNDREFYDMLGKIPDDTAIGKVNVMNGNVLGTSKIKQFFDNVFGGWYGTH